MEISLKATELRVSGGVSKNISLDPWKCLGFIDWKRYGVIYTMAESLPDIDPATGAAVPPVIRFLLDEPRLRAKIQQRLFYGLSRWWWNNGRDSGSPATGRGSLDMGPWIALIGMRLPGYWEVSKVGEPVSSSNQNSPEVDRMEILQLLLDMPTIRAKENVNNHSDGEGLFWGETLTVGQVLDQCYRMSILERPRKNDWKTYQRHTSQLLGTLDTFGLWHMVNCFCSFKNIDSIEELANIRLSDLWLASYSDDDLTSNPSSKAENFQCRAMSLELLRKVGKLKIKWTEYITEHLELDIEDSTLKIFWFGFTAMASPLTQYVHTCWIPR